MPRALLAPALLSLLLATSAHGQTTFPMDVHGAYLHVDSADQANVCTVIGLAAYGFLPGHTIHIEAVGDWNPGPYGDIYNTMLGVFSGSATLLSPSLLHRVPDAIDAGTDIATPYTWPNSEPMDIAEDFGFDASGTDIVVPAGATALFVSVRDNYLRDNSDPDADCGVRITLLDPAAVEPQAHATPLAASPVPSRGGTTLRFALARAGMTRLTIHDTSGRRVRTLVAVEWAAGPHQVTWDGRDDAGRALASGVYFARLACGDRAESLRLSLLR